VKSELSVRDGGSEVDIARDGNLHTQKELDILAEQTYDIEQATSAFLQPSHWSQIPSAGRTQRG